MNKKRTTTKELSILFSALALALPFNTVFVSTALAEASILDRIKSEKILRAGIRRDNPPHSFIDDAGNWVGFDVDIAKALAEEMGASLKKLAVDELTRISYLKSKKIDIAVASMSHTYKRDNEIDFSQTYFTSAQTFITKKSSIKSLNDLVGKKVGVSRGSHAIGNWNAWLQKKHPMVKEPTIVEFSSKHVGIEAVKKGAIAGYAEDYEVLASFAKANKSLHVLDGAIGMKQDGIGVRENDSKIRDAINFSLQSIKKKGKYKIIYDKWFGPDASTPVPMQTNLEVWPNG